MEEIGRRLASSLRRVEKIRARFVNTDIDIIRLRRCIGKRKALFIEGILTHKKT
jgi:hypothetical protein